MEVAITKMTPKALATCIAPNILFNPFEMDVNVMKAESQKCNAIMEFLIEDFTYLMQDLNSGRSETLIGLVKEQYGDVSAEAETVPRFVNPPAEERGRSEEDERGKKGIFGRRKSRSRSRGRRNGLKDGKK